MEVLLIDGLRRYGLYRSFLMDKFFRIIPISSLQNNTTFHWLVGVSLFLTLISIFSTVKSISLFSLHPLFMGIGCMGFIAEGVVAYRNNGLLEIISPIMQHNKKHKVFLPELCNLS